MSNDESVREDGDNEKMTPEEKASIDKAIESLDGAMGLLKGIHTTGKSPVDFLEEVLDALSPLMPGMKETEDALTNIVEAANKVRGSLGSIALARVFSRMKRAARADMKKRVLAREPENQEELNMHIAAMQEQYPNPEEFARKIKERFGDKVSLTMHMAELDNDQAARLANGEDPKSIIKEAESRGKVITLEDFNEMIKERSGDNKMVAHLVPPEDMMKTVVIVDKDVDNSKPLNTEAELDEHARATIAQHRARREQMAINEAQAQLRKSASEPKGSDDPRPSGFSED